MNNPDIYLYGMTVYSTLHLLRDSYPAPDSYGEIRETHRIPGGETGNSAVILSNYGYKVSIDGPFLGYNTREGITSFYKKYDVDCTRMKYDPEFEGVEDLVLIDGSTRTVFGRFSRYFNSGKKWTDPDPQAIKSSKIVSIDPFFREESVKAAEYCVELGKRYVTIDCKPDSFIFKNSAACVISREFIRNEFPDIKISDVVQEYLNNANGLVVFTFGSEEILFGRKDTGINRVLPYKVNVVSTLGAGDTFRAGIVFGLLNDFEDMKTVKFAAATAAMVCTRFPMAQNPPTLAEVTDLMKE